MIANKRMGIMKPARESGENEDEFDDSKFGQGEEEEHDINDIKDQLIIKLRKIRVLLLNVINYSEIQELDIERNIARH